MKNKSEEIFEEIMGKYLLKLRKDNISQIKEAQRSPSSIKTKQTRHTIIKLLKTKDIEKILASREVFFFFPLKRFIYLLRKDRACMGVEVGGAAEGENSRADSLLSAKPDRELDPRAPRSKIMKGTKIQDHEVGQNRKLVALGWAGAPTRKVLKVTR